MCLADYENYFEVYKQMDKVYKNKLQFQKMSLVNISEAGRFAADRSIEDYARDIWHLKKLK
jgi:starch phosphorylase